MLKNKPNITNPATPKYNSSIKTKSNQRSAYGSQNLAPKSTYK